MIWNVVDHRKHRYRWQEVNVVVEDVWNDNSCADSDHAEPNDDRSILYADKKNVSLRKAIAWAQGLEADVTLYIYNKGDGI